MKMADRQVGKCCHLFEEFARLFRRREGYDDAAGLDKARSMLLRWIEEAREYGISELKAFVAKLFQDMDAVVAAMVRAYSQELKRVRSLRRSRLR